MPKLPPQVADADVPTVEKLVWFYIYNNPGEHSARSLSAELGVQVRTALSKLVERGALIEEEAPRGTRAGKYRAVTKPKKPAPMQEGVLRNVPPSAK
ncbi:hypothetical protein [Deinococcus fonticola]|uniref:hypothetical protein n=1 Tax=Deinococcus fonticola TaxID=2528713 RepID=UPI0010752101|nr:hypothetical protein [Deinococcus fonticola]